MSLFPRLVVTDGLIEHLEQALEPAGVLVGDGVAPVAGGWVGGQPSRGDFVPYLVVATMPATPNQRDPVGRVNSSWLASYNLRTVGGSRQQVEWTADRARALVGTFMLPRNEINGWGLQQAVYATLGAVMRNDSTDPPYWECNDSVALWLEAPST